jgi:hypothetical protein
MKTLKWMDSAPFADHGKRRRSVNFILCDKDCNTGAGSFDVSYVTLMSSVYCRMRLFVFILCVGVVRERRWLQLTADSRVFEKVRRKDESGYLWFTHDAA